MISKGKDWAQSGVVTLTESSDNETETSWTTMSVHVHTSGGGDPLQVIQGLADTVELFDTKIRVTVSRARKRGKTWDEIGQALGISRQAAWERFS